MSLFTAAIQGLLQSALLQEITALVQNELAANANFSLATLQAKADGKADSLLSGAIGRFPQWEQPFLELIVGLGESEVNSWVNGLVAHVYEKLASTATAAVGPASPLPSNAA